MDDRAPLEARVAEIAALDQPLRRDLYALVAGGDGWVSRDEATAALGIPRSVAAFHLDRLAEAELLEVRFVRPEGRSGPGAGRPAKQYRRAAAEVAVSIPERRYDLAGAMLADAVVAAEATGEPVGAALSAAARHVGCETGAVIRDQVDGDSTTDLRAAVSGALESLGYEPRDQNGEIILSNCPFHRLAERHRTLTCGMNLDLLAGMCDALGTSSDLEARLEPVDGYCCVRLR
jgi:predicted ArsR family transcriptional regulator